MHTGGDLQEEFRLTIVIVSWNVSSLLADCLASIAHQRGALPLEVIVVDSASHDDTVTMVRRDFAWVTLLAQGQNVGFARGNNIGMRHARGEYVLLLNPDTVVQPGALQRMAAYLDEQPGVGLLGPLLLNADGSIQSSRRRFPTRLTAFFESTWLEAWAPAAMLRYFRALDLPEGVTVDVDWVTGAAMMVRGSVIAQVGGMDEAFFMYSEELDWCRRIKAAGWRVVYFPHAAIVHLEGRSSEQVVTARHIYFQKAKLRYFRKYHGRLFSATLRLFLLASYAWQLLLEAAKGLLGHRRDLRRQRVASYWHVLKSGLRPAGY